MNNDDKKQTKNEAPEEVVADETMSSEPATNEETTVEAAQIEIEHWKNQYLRALADYQNLDKRVHEEIRKLQSKTKFQLLNKFLDILDTIYKAEVFVKDPGLSMVRENFLRLLKDEGATEMNLVGKEYDPYKAEAIEMVEDPKNHDKVVEVVSKGYMLGDEILRIAQVKVGK